MQAHLAFKKAFPAFKGNESFIAVAKYVYGEDWKSVLLTREQQEEEDQVGLPNQSQDDNGSSSSGNQAEDNYGPLNPKTLYSYINETILDHDVDVAIFEAFSFFLNI